MEHSARESGYAGFGILPEWLDGYLSEPYFDLYRHALETAKKLGMKLCLYDENGFPSGSAGGLLAKKYPEDTMKRLDKEEKEVTGPCRAEFLIRAKDAQYLGAVLFRPDTAEITDISDCFRHDGRVCHASFSVPGGTYKIMAFFVRRDGYDRVDYLDRKAVEHLIGITHEAYYERFRDYFGTVIDSAFYDEPMLYQAKGRTWTGNFNSLFQKKYGYDPITLYPALWYDIGEKTAFARSALFGFRTELFSENYIKTMNEWCHAHGIALMGHMDQEENVNPVTTCGDLMKIFQHQDIPGIDEISFYDRARKAYKIVSSAAYNWDKPLVMTEVYGAMGEEIGIGVLYKDIMNQFVRGINYVVPHAVWYDSEKGVTFPPELSYRSQNYAAELPAYNNFTARTAMLLRGGCPYGRYRDFISHRRFKSRNALRLRRSLFRNRTGGRGLYGSRRLFVYGAAPGFYLFASRNDTAKMSCGKRTAAAAKPGQFRSVPRIDHSRGKHGQLPRHAKSKGLF